MTRPWRQVSRRNRASFSHATYSLVDGRGAAEGLLAVGAAAGEKIDDDVDKASDGVGADDEAAAGGAGLGGAGVGARARAGTAAGTVTTVTGDGSSRDGADDGNKDGSSAHIDWF